MNPLPPRDPLDWLTTPRDSLEQIAHTDRIDTYIAQTTCDGQPVVSILFDINMSSPEPGHSLPPGFSEQLALSIINNTHPGQTTAHYLPRREVVAVHYFVDSKTTALRMYKCLQTLLFEQFNLVFNLCYPETISLRYVCREYEINPF